jgi:hypothetical protein
MSRRIEARPSKVGAGEGADPEAIADLEARREKHERLTRGKPVRTFGEVLRARLGPTSTEDPAADATEPKPEKGAKDPLLGLDPGQDASLANRPAGRRSGRVIVKG